LRIAEPIVPEKFPVIEEKNAVSVRIGRWFEARGTGWGVAVVPIMLLVLIALAASRLVG